jgi:hypothetical protein
MLMNLGIAFICSLSIWGRGDLERRNQRKWARGVEEIRRSPEDRDDEVILFDGKRPHDRDRLGAPRIVDLFSYMLART